MTTRELALEYFAKRNTGSGGRQMPSHYSNARPAHLECADADRLAVLPGCGMAWGIQLDGKNNLVVTTIGDAATRQGDFFEAICFAKEKKLPVLFFVEDNAYGISMPDAQNQSARDRRSCSLTTGSRSTARQSAGLRRDGGSDSNKIRAGGGPFFFWVNDGAALQSHEFRRSKTLSQRGRTARHWKNSIRLNAGRID